MHDYTIVIQEYFQARVKNWFDTVGRIVFKVKHYWLRFEFAPGRGQIHAHCLLICDNLEMQKNAFQAMQDALKRDIVHDLEYERASIYQEWAERELAMTASLPDDVDLSSFEQPTSENHPASVKLKDVPKSGLKADGMNFQVTTQYHICTDYCMRKRKYL